MNALQGVVQKIWEGAALTGDDKIALCLLLAMLASLGHLMTMLATRWGDRHVAFKSLLASLLVHSVCLLGLEVFEPLETAAAYELPPEVDRPEFQTRILAESEDSVALSDSGNTPVPDLPTSPQVELERMPQNARLMKTPETPEREVEVLDSLRSDVEDVSQFEQSETPQQANAVDAGREGERVAAANDIASNEQTMQLQSKADVYVPDTQRAQPTPGDITPSPRPQERQMSSGSAPKVDTNLVTEDMSLLTATSDIPNAIPLPTPDLSEEVRTRRSPLTGPTDDETAGLSSEQTRRTQMARSFESRLPRPNRTIRSPVAGERPVRTNSLTAKTPIPLTSDYDEVRSGMTNLNVTDALESAAKLVDTGIDNIRRRETQPATYQLRDLNQRREAAAKFGGTSESEAAVEMSLQWLSQEQLADGHWDAESFGSGLVRVDEQGVNRNFAGRNADTGISALITLSFLGAGYTHQEGRYALNVDRALNWIIDQQDEEGSLAGNASHYARMYCHAMATYALAEALGMQNELLMGPIVEPSVIASGEYATEAISAAMMAQAGVMPYPFATTSNTATSTQADLIAYDLRRVDEVKLRSALLKAVTYTISQQDPRSGGWRYKFGQEGDVSMFGWQMMSLKSAEIAGVTINPKVRRRMVEFLNSVRQGPNGGLFGYRRSIVLNGQQTEPVNQTMTAEALFCQQMLGYPRESAASREAVQYLLNHMPRLSELNMYYWYYGTLAMYQYGGQPWENWNNVVRDTLIQQQRTDGKFAGSWDPNGPWGRYGGRLYSTAISTLTLEVYYRLLPLYRMNQVPSQ